MQQREVASTAKRAVIISPNPRMSEELIPLLTAHVPGMQCTQVRSYPGTRELSGTFDRSASYLCFLDIGSNRDKALEVLAELVRSGLPVQVIALLEADDPDLILRSIRAGAAEFLLHPYTSEQVQSALGKLSRVQAAGNASGRETAK